MRTAAFLFALFFLSSPASVRAQDVALATGSVSEDAALVAPDTWRSDATSSAEQDFRLSFLDVRKAVIELHEPVAVAENFYPEAESLGRITWVHLPSDGFERLNIAPGSICDALTAAAVTHQLPVVFFTRLIWQESRFNRWATSRAGAQGLAQFMPRVAASMGLADPFEPGQALSMSARLLGQLHRRFGNWGLAAAAYNAGTRRISDWLAKRGRLPKETREYVRRITGVAAERWAAGSGDVEFERNLPENIPCRQIVVAHSTEEDSASPAALAEVDPFPPERAIVLANVPFPPERPSFINAPITSAAASDASTKARGVRAAARRSKAPASQSSRSARAGAARPAAACAKTGAVDKRSCKAVAVRTAQR